MKKIEFYFRFRYPFERCFENDVLKAFQLHNQKTSTLNSHYLTREDFINSKYFELFKPFYETFKHPNIEKLKNSFLVLKSNNGFNSNCLIFTLENWGGDFLDSYSSERNKIESGFAAIKEIRKDGFVYFPVKVSKTKDNSCVIELNTREYFVPYTLTFEHLNDLINNRIHNIINEKTVDYLEGKSPSYKSLEERAKSLQGFLDYHYENYPSPKKEFLDFISKKKNGISDYLTQKQDNYTNEDIELVKTFNNWLDNKLKDLENYTSKTTKNSIFEFHSTPIGLKYPITDEELLSVSTTHNVLIASEYSKMLEDAKKGFNNLSSLVYGRKLTLKEYVNIQIDLKKTKSWNKERINDDLNYGVVIDGKTHPQIINNHRAYIEYLKQTLPRIEDYLEVIELKIAKAKSISEIEISEDKINNLLLPEIREEKKQETEKEFEENNFGEKLLQQIDKYNLQRDIAINRGGSKINADFLGNYYEELIIRSEKLENKIDIDWFIENISRLRIWKNFENINMAEEMINNFKKLNIITPPFLNACYYEAQQRNNYINSLFEKESYYWTLDKIVKYESYLNQETNPTILDKNIQLEILTKFYTSNRDKLREIIEEVRTKYAFWLDELYNDLTFIGSKEQLNTFFWSGECKDGVNEFFNLFSLLNNYINVKNELRILADKIGEIKSKSVEHLLVHEHQKIDITKEKPSFESIINEIENSENRFWKGLPMKKVVEHFKVMTTRKNNNKDSYLTEEQFISFLKKGFLNDTNQLKQKINCSTGDKGFVILRFYELYDLAVSQYAHPRPKKPFINLFLDCFDNWGESTVESFFKPNKTKEKW